MVQNRVVVRQPGTRFYAIFTHSHSPRLMFLVPSHHKEERRLTSTPTTLFTEYTLRSLSIPVFQRHMLEVSYSGLSQNVNTSPPREHVQLPLPLPSHGFNDFNQQDVGRQPRPPPSTESPIGSPTDSPTRSAPPQKISVQKPIIEMEVMSRPRFLM